MATTSRTPSAGTAATTVDPRKRSGWNPWRALFIAVWGAHLSFILLSAGSLPAVVMDASPGGKTWSRDAFVAISLGMGVLVPALCTWGVAFVARHFTGVLNMPNKDYWMAPERRATTLVLLGRLMWPLGLLIVLQQAGSTVMTLASVMHWPLDPRLPLAGGVLWTAAMVAWVGVVLWIFRLPDRRASSSSTSTSTSTSTGDRQRPRAPHRRPGR
ncbi:hypothetical protein ACQ859_01505 [Roseateles chitinivorans]|uniref:hypothetical protein n=1 Tax=Roseateles chitinivorans TaxID=2917965 RepID=UPI003D66463F